MKKSSSWEADGSLGSHENLLVSGPCSQPCVSSQHTPVLFLLDTFGITTLSALAINK